MKTTVQFLVVASVFEIVALVVTHFYHVSWLLDILIGVFVVYLVFLAIRGYRRQLRIDMPEILHAKMVRKRHWRFF